MNHAPGTIEARLQRLEDLEAIRNLKHRYQDGVDTVWRANHVVDVPRLVDDLFTTDIEFVAPIDDAGTMVTVNGAAAMVQFLTDHHRRVRFSMHFVANDLLELSGDEATGQWSVLAPGSGDSGSSWYAARYVERYRRTPKGWRIARSEQFVALSPPVQPWRLIEPRQAVQ